MIDVACHLHPGHLKTLNDFADSLGMTWFQFWCLPWAQYGSTSNPKMRMHLSHRFMKSDAETETTYDLWKAISYFLVTHLKLAGGLAGMFRWDEAEYLFRIGGTHNDLFELTRRDVEKRTLDTLSNIVVYKTYTVSAEKYLYDWKLNAEFLKISTDTPSPNKKPSKKFSIDMGTDGHPKLDLGAYESESESDSESLDSPIAPEKAAAVFKKFPPYEAESDSDSESVALAVAAIKAAAILKPSVDDSHVVREQKDAPSPTVQEESKMNSDDVEDEMVVEMAEMSVDMSRIKTMSSFAGPPCPCDSGNDASKESSIMEFHESPRKHTAKGLLKQAPTSPSAAKTVVESPIPDSTPSTASFSSVGMTPSPKTVFSDGSQEKPIEFDDSPAASPINKCMLYPHKKAAGVAKERAEANKDELVGTPSTTASRSTTASAVNEDWSQERARRLVPFHKKSIAKNAEKIAKRTMHIKSNGKVARKSSSKKAKTAAGIFFKPLSVKKKAANEYDK